jgi:hypothetical protein
MQKNSRDTYTLGVTARCEKCGNMLSTDKCKLPRTEPAKCLHCGEGHPADYRGCKVYQEIIGNRFPSSKPITNNHRSTTRPTQEPYHSKTKWNKTRHNLCANNQKWSNDIDMLTKHTRRYITKNNARFFQSIRSHTYEASWTNEFFDESPHNSGFQTCKMIQSYKVAAWNANGLSQHIK